MNEAWAYESIFELSALLSWKTNWGFAVKLSTPDFVRVAVEGKNGRESCSQSYKCPKIVICNCTVTMTRIFP